MAPPIAPSSMAVPPPADDGGDLTTKGQVPGAGGVAVLRLDQGSVLRLDRSWVIGRDPTPPSTHPHAVPFGVVDATMSVSKTHLVVGPTSTGASVVDLHSTNGVSVQEPGSAPRPLVPGDATAVVLGTTITYGERAIVIE